MFVRAAVGCVSVKLKQQMRGGIRGAHVALASPDLPMRLALYMHSLDACRYSSFEECISYLRSAGYRFVHVDEFLAYPNSHLAFLSFDDNYRAWYQALPLLERLSIPATFYINTLPLRDRASPEVTTDYFERVHHLGERVPLDSAEIRSIRSAGHAIGAHTHSHAMLTAKPRREAEEDILRNKQILEEILGEGIEHFSYPFGMRRHFSRQLLDYCQRVGFRTVASAIPGLQHGRQVPFRINRTLWRLERPLEFNLESLRIDGRLFERLTGLSAVG
jgi:peptidoglycan/xylan/chitin deacetylase (PgdA/CDA1 family)